LSSLSFILRWRSRNGAESSSVKTYNSTTQLAWWATTVIYNTAAHSDSRLLVAVVQSASFSISVENLKIECFSQANNAFGTRRGVEVPVAVPKAIEVFASDELS